MVNTTILFSKLLQYIFRSAPSRCIPSVPRTSLTPRWGYVSEVPSPSLSSRDVLTLAGFQWLLFQVPRAKMTVVVSQKFTLLCVSLGERTGTSSWSDSRTAPICCFPAFLRWLISEKLWQKNQTSQFLLVFFIIETLCRFPCPANRHQQSVLNSAHSISCLPEDSIGPLNSLNRHYAYCLGI